MGSELDIQSRAAQWLVRLREGDGATWESFANWLAEDPRHGEAYDRVEQLDRVIEPLLPDLLFRTSAPDVDEAADAFERPARRSRGWVYGGGALAASIAALLLMSPLTSDRYEVATKPGERKTISLDSETHVTLNGATHMIFDRKNPRFASLESGEALFRVRHDAAQPFTLEVGENRVEDVGTIFNVVRDGGQTRVAVAEGVVVYNPGGEAVTLNAGQRLVDAPSQAVEVGPTAIEAVGAWQKGRLVYSGASLKQVAADLGRSLAIRITVSPDIAGRPFTGIIVLDSSGIAERENLEVALNVMLEPGAGGWLMKPAGRAGH